jgi:NAD(P)-dependent dehydrogenase (short-subunit alcohol dehydrogenase family)
MMERVIIVTGAGRGIGREIALKLSEQGDIPIIVDKDLKLAKETESQIRKSGPVARSYCADLANPEEVIRVFREIMEDVRKIDALINNAGGLYLVKPIDELTVDFWDLVIDTNLKTAFLCSLEAFKYMKQAKYGKILNLTSSLVITSGVGLSPYISAKAGVIGLTRALAMDMGPYNITVNAIAPGLTGTEYAYQVYGYERFDRVKQLRAIKKDQSPRDLIGAILFLIDPASDFITGQTLVVDGGRAFI